MNNPKSKPAPKTYVLEFLPDWIKVEWASDDGVISVTAKSDRGFMAGWVPPLCFVESRVQKFVAERGHRATAKIMAQEIVDYVEKWQQLTD